MKDYLVDQDSWRETHACMHAQKNLFFFCRSTQFTYFEVKTTNFAKRVTSLHPWKTMVWHMSTIQVNSVFKAQLIDLRITSMPHSATSAYCLKTVLRLCCCASAVFSCFSLRLFTGIKRDFFPPSLTDILHMLPTPQGNAFPSREAVMHCAHLRSVHFSIIVLSHAQHLACLEPAHQVCLTVLLHQLMGFTSHTRKLGGKE